MKSGLTLFKTMTAGVLSLSLLSGCSQKAEQNEVKQIDIAVIVKSASSQYWNPVWNACDDIEEELGENKQVNIIRLAPENESVEEQIPLIQQAVAQHVDAIILAAVDREAENEALASATAAGIPVLTIDSDVSYEGRASYIGTMNDTASEMAARYAADLIDAEGKIGIIYHGDVVTANARKDAFINELTNPVREMPAGAGSKQNNSVPGETDRNQNETDETAQEETDADPVSVYEHIEIAEVLNGESDWEVSKKMAEKLIKEDGVDLIFATNRRGAWGACETISEMIEAGTLRQDEVHVISFDYFGAEEGNGNQDAGMYLDAGILDAIIVQNPYNMGYMSVRYAIDLAQGKQIASRVDTGVTLVTADNIHDDDIQFLINN